MLQFMVRGWLSTSLIAMAALISEGQGDSEMEQCMALSSEAIKLNPGRGEHYLLRSVLPLELLIVPSISCWNNSWHCSWVSISSCFSCWRMWNWWSVLGKNWSLCRCICRSGLGKAEEAIADCKMALERSMEGSRLHTSSQSFLGMLEGKEPDYTEDDLWSQLIAMLARSPVRRNRSVVVHL